MNVHLTIRALLLAGLVASAGEAVAQGNPFAEGVRTTPWLSAEDEAKTFHLPEGFEIQLFAAEPDIFKPMNMAFDAQGRMWLTDTLEYPYQVEKGKKGRDSVKILEDTDGDGRADRISTFADELNIPIGVYPYKNGAIVWSIPSIWHLQDLDGDGKADRRHELYGPTGDVRDTHGMHNAFRRGFDGWLYVNHGFNNDSTIRGRDGSRIQMNSGNTYRVQLNGSRVEQVTWGQVNPFGAFIDAMGYRWSADCHSSPIYQLLPGAYYPSFGKPHDGLGFAPEIMRHSHGSTAISGIVIIDDPSWPGEFQGNAFVGNVMTSRINRDRFEHQGSSPTAIEMPDFLRTDDPWFRPVDLQIGPDGALYVADFYNRIIGHYEVPLTHEGRDRTSGRIWRIVYTGAENRPTDLTRQTLAGVIGELGGPNHTRRMLAMNHLVDSVGDKAVPVLRHFINSSSANENHRTFGMWVIERLGGLPGEMVTAFANDGSEQVRSHVMRVLGQRKKVGTPEFDLLCEGLVDDSPHVRRAAAESLATQTDTANIPAILSAMAACDEADVHLRHQLLIALRAQFRATSFDGYASLPNDLSVADRDMIASASLSVENAHAAGYLLEHVRSGDVSADEQMEQLRHVARFLPANRVGELSAFVQETFADRPAEELALFTAVERGLKQGGRRQASGIKEWAKTLAERIFHDGASGNAWFTLPLAGAPESSNPWFAQQRVSNDGDESSWFLCSLPPGGETWTGVLRSPTFEVSDRLSFFVAGHRGFPDRDAHDKNVIRLVEAETGRVLKTALPPRHDTAQQVEWDTTEFVGRDCFVEVADGDTDTAYAWLAVGRFSIEALNASLHLDPKPVGELLGEAVRLVNEHEFRRFAPELHKVATGNIADEATRILALETLLKFNEPRAADLVNELLVALGTPLATKVKLIEATGRGGATGREILESQFETAPYSIQQTIALALARNRDGSEKLLKAVEEGRAPARLLADRKASGAPPIIASFRMAAAHHEASQRARR